MATKTWACDKEQSIGDFGTNRGSGGDDHAPVGKWTGVVFRELLDFDIDWKDVVRIQKATLVLRRTGAVHVARGASPRVIVRRVTGTWTEGGGGEDSWSTSAGTVWDGPATTSAGNVDSGALGTSDDGFDRIDITDIVGAWAPSTVQKENGSPGSGTAADRRGVRIVSYDEASTSRTTEWYSRRAAKEKRPVIELRFDDNHPPSAPTIVSPVPPTITGTATSPGFDGCCQIEGLKLVMRVRCNDLDDGDYITGTELEAWTETAEMDSDGAVTGGSLFGSLAGTGQITAPYTGQPSEVLFVVTGWDPGQRAKVRVRTRDRRGTWGLNTGPLHGWSPFLLVEMDSRPRPPVNLVLFDSGSTSPEFAGEHVDPDKGSLAGVETQVWEVTTRGIEIIQNTTSFVPTTLAEAGTGTVGDEELDGSPLATRNGTGRQDVAGGTAWRVQYSAGGHPLIEGHRYARRHRTVDQFLRVGVWSDVLSWTVVNANLPQAIPEQGVKQDTRTPTIGATLAVLFDRVQLRGYPSFDSPTLLLDTGEVTVSPSAVTWSAVWGSAPAWTFAATLQWGQTVWIERRVRKASDGNWTDYAPREAMPINALPRSPIVSVEGAVERTSGGYVIETATPRITVEARDRDLPGDTVSRRVIEFRTSPTGAPVYTSDVASGLSIVSAFDVPVSRFALETQLYIRARTHDSSGQPGPDSADVALLLHQAPTVAAGTPPDPTDPTPTINAAVVYHGGEVLDFAVVRIEQQVAGSWDEVFRDSEVTGFPYDLPAGLLSDVTRYRAAIVVCDTGGLCTILDPGTAQYAEAAFLLGPTVLSAAAWATTAPPVDPFTRTVSDGWGTASTSGGDWSVEGAAADFDVNGTEGTMALTAAGVTHSAFLRSVALADADTVVKVKTDKLAVGGGQALAIVARRQPDDSHYVAQLSLATDARVWLTIGKTVGGAVTVIAGPVDTGVTHVAGIYLSLRFQLTGTTIRARAWLSSGAEPGTWDLSVTDTTAALQGPGSIGLRAQLDTGVTNAPVLVTWDALATT